MISNSLLSETILYIEIGIDEPAKWFLATLYKSSFVTAHFN